MDRGENSIISTNTQKKNRIIDKNRSDIGLFCCEFLDRVIFQESDS